MRMTRLSNQGTWRYATEQDVRKAVALTGGDWDSFKDCLPDRHILHTPTGRFLVERANCR